MIYIFIGAAIVIIVLLIVRFARGKSQDALMDEMDEMSGEEFENYCADLLSKNGYTVESMTRETGDYGADILISREGEWTAVQCKRYSKPVGVKAVQEAYASMSYYNCAHCAVITNSGFTSQAENLAAKNGVLLWDREFIYSLRNGNEAAAEPKNALLNFSRIINDAYEGDFLLFVDGRQAETIPQNESVNLGEWAGIHKITVKSGRKKAAVTIQLEKGERRFFACGFVRGKLVLAEIAE